MRKFSVQDIHNKKNGVIVSLNDILNDTDISNLDSIKRTHNYFDWVEKKTRIIHHEKNNINPLYSKINRGSVVWIEFGFNVGDEFGGKHPAIVLRKTTSTLFVVPLSSQEPTKKTDFNIEIKKVYGFKNIPRWTNVLRLQSVSERRVDYNASIGNVKGEVLDLINKALQKNYVF